MTNRLLLISGCLEGCRSLWFLKNLSFCLLPDTKTWMIRSPNKKLKKCDNSSSPSETSTNSSTLSSINNLSLQMARLLSREKHWGHQMDLYWCEALPLAKFRPCQKWSQQGLSEHARHWQSKWVQMKKSIKQLSFRKDCFEKRLRCCRSMRLGLSNCRMVKMDWSLSSQGLSDQSQWPADSSSHTTSR